MQDSTALPDLRMLPTSALEPHEDPDPRRVEKLSKRLLEEGLLKNPPIVAAIPGTERYVVLDGANRAQAFAAVGVPHIVAQLVSYNDPGVILDTWYHVVSGMPFEDFERAMEGLEELQIRESNREEARCLLKAEEAVTYFVCDLGVRVITADEGSRYENNLEMLKVIVGTYKGRADIIRASNDIWEIQKPCYPEITALMIFPRLHPEDILFAAANGDRVPSGITRHIITARALNINIPIGILMADWSLEQKRDWLEEWWMERLAANAIRYYAEATFSFNE